MGEMVAAIGLALEAEILDEVKSSKYFSFIIDEATDIHVHVHVSVTKSLGLCVQYIDSEATVRVKVLKLVEIKQGTADTITELISDYLSASSLDQDKDKWY